MTVIGAEGQSSSIGAGRGSAPEQQQRALVLTTELRDHLGRSDAHESERTVGAVPDAERHLGPPNEVARDEEPPIQDGQAAVDQECVAAQDGFAVRPVDR